MNSNIMAFLDTLDLSQDKKMDIASKLQDIEDRGVRPALVGSYCKSLGWMDIPHYWEAYMPWRAEKIEADEPAVVDADRGNEFDAIESEVDQVVSTDTKVTAAIRAVLSDLWSAATGVPAESDMSLDQMFTEIYNMLSYAVNTKQDTDDQNKSTLLAVNKLMVDFLRNAGYTDSDVSDMSLAEMSRRINNHMYMTRALADVSVDLFGK